MWGQERYDSYEAMFEDRVNFRSTWGDLIEAYNTPDASRTGSEMIAEGNDMYVGMRRVREWKACIENKVFDHVIWVDACERLPLEGPKSMEMKREHADLFVDNNGPEENLAVCVDNLQILLKNEGYDVGVPADVIIGPGGIAPEEFQEPELEDRLEWTDKPTNAIQVLDHGFFEVKSVMNSDAEIAESARMSYGRGTKKVNNDGGLINYLVRNHHTSPLEMGEIMFHMRLPIFVMRQLVRHRTANLNEYSGRYSEMVRLFYVPELEHIKYQSDGPNKQMSGSPLEIEEAKECQDIIVNASDRAFDDYEELLGRNMSREGARIVLPLNTYTECVWKLDVSNLIKFLYLRDDDHAQWEIRVYARLIGEAVERFFPMVYASYMRERESVKLTQTQIEALIRGEVSLDDMSKSECAQVADILANYD
jgi:thymidylate synthase (FAD)